MLTKIKLIVVLLALSMVSLEVNSQSAKDSLNSIWNDLKQPSKLRAQALNDLIQKEYLEQKTDSAYILAKALEKFTIEHNLIEEKANTLNTLGNINFLIGNFEEATTFFQSSLKLHKSVDNKKGESMALGNIGKMYKQSYNLDKALQYYNESLVISKSINDTINIINILVNTGNIYNFRFKTDEALDYYLEALKLSETINDQRSKALIYINLGHNYTIRKDYDKAVYYLKESIAISKALGNKLLQTGGLETLAQNYFQQKKFNKLISTAEECLLLSTEISNKPIMRSCHYYLYEGYSGIKNFEKAVKHMKISNAVNSEILNVESTKQLQKFEIEKVRLKDSLDKVAENLKTKLLFDSKIEKEKTEKRNLTIGLSSTLFAFSIIGLLMFKNTRKKQLILKKDNEIQIQQKEKMLKDMELQAIDAMIEGQEKERQRLASDLHDSVGASLIAAKLQFEHLTNSANQPEHSEDLIKKVSTLLEDAYVEVRSMAHLKNSGVLATNGLLPAIEKLTDNASNSNGLQFEVQSFGLEHRLENSLEISIFRIIQELITNIIKHAEASETTIHLTNHEDSLNIMVEDNGKGFNPNQITKTNIGMGISSIDKRVEHLGGTMTIESENHKGTTVIIDIPLS
jgi:signal transduction histidine kinase